MLLRALELVTEVDSRGGLTGGRSWGLLVVSVCQRRLGAAAAADRRFALLDALLAATRAVMSDPSDGQRWGELTDSLISLRCWRAAHVVVDHAYSLNPQDALVRELRIRVVGDLGLSDQVAQYVDELGDDTHFPATWRHSARAFALKCRGEAEGALAEVDAAIAGEPDKFWFRDLRANILLQLDRLDHARAEMTWLWREAPIDEYDGLSTAAMCAFFRDDREAARELSRRLTDVEQWRAGASTGAVLLGMMELLDDDESGADRVADALCGAMLAREVDELAVWLSAVRHRGRTLRDRLQPAVDRAKQRLDDRYDGLPPFRQADAELLVCEDVLGRPDVAGPSSEQAGDALPAALVALELARGLCLLLGDDEGALGQLAAAAARRPDLPELATFAAEGAPAFLRARAESPTEPPEATTPADGAARRLVTAGNLSGPAGDSGAVDELVVSVELPSSWFAGMSDPVTQHEVFLRYLPATRLVAARRSALPLPAVRVRACDDLEPASYRIRLPDGEIQVGTVPTADRYVAAAYVDALTPQLRRLAERLEGSLAGLWRVPEEAVSDPGDALVTWSPAETVIRQAAEHYSRSGGVPTTGAGMSAAPSAGT